MDTGTASEYATATAEGRVSVENPGVPDNDNFIEYQDARGFLAADLLKGGGSIDKLAPDARAAFDKLRAEIFATLDPDRSGSAAEVKILIERTEQGLNYETEL